MVNRKRSSVDQVVIFIRKANAAALPLEHLVWRLLGIYILLRHHPW